MHLIFQLFHFFYFMHVFQTGHETNTLFKFSLQFIGPFDDSLISFSLGIGFYSKE